MPIVSIVLSNKLIEQNTDSQIQESDKLDMQEVESQAQSSEKKKEHSDEIRFRDTPWGISYSDAKWIFQDFELIPEWVGINHTKHHVGEADTNRDENGYRRMPVLCRIQCKNVGVE